MTCLGIALVAALIFVLFGFLGGLRRTVMQSADRNNWIVLSRNTVAEAASEISREQFDIFRARPELAINAGGEQLASPEIITAFNPDPDHPYNTNQFSYLRGVAPIAYQVHRSIHLQSGRLPAAGKNEAIVGARLAAKYPRLAPPAEFRFGRHLWEVVGVFAENGSARESEIWTNLDVLEQDLEQAGTLSSVHVVLKPTTESSFKHALTADSRLGLDSMSERQYYLEQADVVDQLERLGLMIGLIIALGAAFGGMNTMYSAVARRSHEVGVLGALGFSRLSILLSFLIESVLLAMAGGIAGDLLGAAIAAACGLDRRATSVGALIFSFRFSASAFTAGLVAALAIGVFGGILPAWHASRSAPVDSLRTA